MRRYSRDAPAGAYAALPPIMPSGIPKALCHMRSVTKDRKSTRLNSSHLVISYAVFCLKKKTHCRTERPCPHIRQDHHPHAILHTPICACGRLTLMTHAHTLYSKPSTDDIAYSPPISLR